MLGLLSALSTVSSLVVMSMSLDGSVFYFGSCLGILAGQTSVAIRSLLSKASPN